MFKGVRKDLLDKIQEDISAKYGKPSEIN